MMKIEFLAKSKRAGAVLSAAIIFLTFAVSLALIIFFGYKYSGVKKNIGNLTSKDYYSYYECEYVLGYSVSQLRGRLGEPAAQATVNEENSSIVTDNAYLYRYASADIYYRRPSLSDGTNEPVSYKAVIYSDVIPAPRGIRIGCSPEQVESKYPVDGTLDEWGDYSAADGALKYHMIYGEMQVNSYAYEVWSKPQDGSKSALLFMVYADSSSQITFFFSDNALVKTEYLKY